MSDQIWGLINLLVGAGLAIAGGWFSHRRIIQFETQKRAWNVEDKKREFRLETKLRRLDQAENLMVLLTDKIHVHRDQLFLALTKMTAPGILTYLNNYVDESINLHSKDIHKIPAVIYSIEDKDLSEIWRQLNSIEDATRQELSNLMRELEIVVKGGTSNILSVPDWNENFAEKIKSLIVLHQTQMVLFYKRIDKLRIKFHNDAAQKE